MRVKRCISMLLVAAMMLTGDPAAVFAEEVTSVSSETESQGEETVVLSDEDPSDVIADEIIEDEEEEDVSAGEDIQNGDNIASGTINNITWVIDANGCLSITGEGDYYVAYHNAPWNYYEYVEWIKTAKVTVTGMTSCEGMFSGCTHLTSVDLSGLDTSNITNMSSMFFCCSSLEEIDFSDIDTSNVSDMSSMFSSCKSLRKITGLDTSNTLTFYSMFDGCTSLTDVDSFKFVLGIDLSMTNMFKGCTSLKKVDLSQWSITADREDDYLYFVTIAMFYGCTALEEVHLGVVGEGMANAEDMFYGCSNLLTVDWGSRAEKTSLYASNNAFENCTSLQEIDLSKMVFDSYYSKSSSQCYADMFKNASSLSIIHTPYNINEGFEITLPQGTWIDNANNTYTKLPTGLNKSITLYKEESEIEEEEEEFSTANKASLKNVYCIYGSKKTDVLTHAVKLTDDYENVTLLCHIEGNYKLVEKYELYSGSKLVASTVGGEFTNLDLSSMKDQLSIKIIRTDGIKIQQKLLLKIVNTTKSVVEKVDVLGSGFSITLGDDFPIQLLRNQTLKLKLPELPVSFLWEEEHVKVGINIPKQTMASYDSNNGAKGFQPTGFAEQWQKLLKDVQKGKEIGQEDLKSLGAEDLKADVPGVESSVSVSIAGYLEGSWTDDPENGPTVKNIKGSIVLGISASASQQHQFTVWVIPVTVIFTETVKGTLTGEIYYDYEHTYFGGGHEGFGLKGSISVGIEAYGGIGAGKWLSGGVYGSVELGTDFTILAPLFESNGLDDVYVKGEMGLKAYFAKKELSLSLLSVSSFEKTFPEYIDSGKLLIWAKEKNSLLNRIDSTSLAVNGTNDLAEISFDTEEEEFSEINDTFDGTGLYVTNAYAGAAPVLASGDNCDLVIYADYDNSRDNINQTVIKYAKLEADGTVGEEKIVSDDGTADCNQVIYADGEDILVAYLNSDTVFDEDPDITEYAKTFGISVGRYNSATNSFENLGRVDKDNCYCYAPVIQKSDTGVTLTWAENTENNLFGLNDNNVILSAVYANGEWSNPKVLATGINSVRSLAVSENGSTAWVLDNDNDLTTSESTLYIDGVAVLSGPITNLGWNCVPGETGEVLTYEINGGLSYYKSGTSAELLAGGTMDTGSEYYIEDDYAYFCKTQNNSRNVEKIYLGQKNSGGGALTVTEDYIDSFCINNGKMVALVTEADLEDATSMETNSSIRFYSMQRSDLALSDISFETSDVIPGEDMPVTLTVTNNGTADIDSLLIQCGTQKKTEPVSLKVGETKNIITYMTVPEVLENLTVTVQDAAGSDDSLDDNSLSLEIGKTDLGVSTSFMVEEEKYFLETTVSNTSYLGTEAKLVITDDEGTVIESYTEEINGQGQKTYLTDITDFVPENGEKILSATVSTDKEEFYSYNNSSDSVVWKVTYSKASIRGTAADSSAEAVNGNLKWTLDENGYLMVGSADEAITDVPANATEWEEVDASVKNIIFSQSITSVTGSLEKCTNLERTIFYNKECQIADNLIPETVIIVGYYGSTAYQYAMGNHNTFEAMDEETHAHLWDDGVTETEPSETKAGLKKYTCIYCGLEDEVVLPAIGEIISENEEIKTATVTFYNKELDTMNTVNVTSGATIGSIPVPVNEGYTFGGWFTEENGQGSEVTSDTVVSEDMSVYAFWYRDGLYATGVEENYEYTGNVIKPTINVYSGKQLLTVGKDYTISYKNNTNVYDVSEGETGFNASKAPTVIVTGKGNYSGTEKIYYRITKKSVGDVDVTVTVADKLAYTGKNQAPIPSVKWGKTTLTNKKNFTVTYYSDEACTVAVTPKEPGTYYIKVSGNGNYGGERVLSFNIANAGQKTVSSLKVTVKDKKYTGSPIELSATELVVKDGKKTLTAGEDYTVTYSGNHTDVGTATIVIEGKGDIYTGSRKLTFKITGTALSKMKLGGFVKSFTYDNGNELKQTVTLKNGSIELKGIAASEYKALSDTARRAYDYTIAYQNNIYPGTATMLLTGVNGYTGAVKKTYTINGIALSKAKVEGISAKVTYDGNEQKQEALKLSYNGSKLKGIEKAAYEALTTEEKLKCAYTIEYRNNVKVGKASVILKGVSGYTGTITKTYTITKYDLGKDASDRISITLSDTEHAYSKIGTKPEPVVMFGDTVMEAGKDYTLSWKNNTKLFSGTSGSRPTVVVTGKGNFAGTDSTTYFNIVKANLNTENITITVSDKTTSTKANGWKSAVKLTDLGGKTLTAGKDYDVTYVYAESGNTVGANDQVSAGTSIMAKIVGKGNYTGNAYKTYRIVATDINSLTVKIADQSYTGEYVTLSQSDFSFKAGKNDLTDVTFKIVSGSYVNNKNNGNAKVTIEGTGNYGGRKTVTFKIKKKGLFWWWR